MTTDYEAPMESTAGVGRAEAPTRPMYWSIRRELWENRSTYLAPILIAGVFLFGFLLSTVRLPRRMEALQHVDVAKQTAAIMLPFDVAATVIILVTYLAAAFYCLDALSGERRDRSILFWKSLPVSDRTTVLAKASLPLVVLPAVAFVVSLATQIAMLVLSTMVLEGHHDSAVLLWTRLPFVQTTIVMMYGLIVHALWHAPIYAWLLLVSAWARRATLLWAALPFFVVGVFERIVFQTSHVGAFMKYRLTGAMQEAFDFTTRGSAGVTISVTQLAPLKLLATAGFWLGLIAAALFLAAAVRLRRNREPS